MFGLKRNHLATLFESGQQSKSFLSFFPVIRVTRLGEFCACWAIVHFGQWFENCRKK
jgi:hypothetical protein